MEVESQESTSHGHNDAKAGLGSDDLELISQGAEGKLFRGMLCDRKVIIKQRVSKGYRVPELDKRLNKQRLLQETRCMAKCRKAGVATPTLFLVDPSSFTYIMEEIDGHTLKTILRRNESTGYQGECIELAQKVGTIIGRMHDVDVVHGDLTTSNIMIRDTNKQVLLIDFGLGQMQSIIEDKAVDLYVLERAFVSTHPGADHLIPIILEAYRFACKKGTPVLNKLEQVRMRGRKREMIG